jgi:hypothetical protein
MSEETNNMRDALEVLVKRISGELRTGLAAGTLVPSEMARTRWKLTAPPQYDDRGQPLISCRSEQTSEKTWQFAASKAVQEASGTEEYRAAVATLALTYGIGDLAEQHLSKFTLFLAKTILETEGSTQAALDLLTARFIDELNGKPIRYGAEIELQGIVLDIDHIEPVPGIAIRRPVSEDFERDALGIGWFNPTPSVIVRVDRVGVVNANDMNTNDLHREMDRLIAVFRLFCVASVKWICMRQFSDSLITSAGFALHSGPHEVVLHVGRISLENQRKLESFWRRIDSCLPADFSASPGAKSDYLAIAYERYSAALTRHGLLEERIAQAVMALEAILINENQELAYKLRMRAAKLLSFFGEDAIHVSLVLKDAYGVRSTFAHGDRLSYDKTKKLDRRYEPAANLLAETLEILRKALVAGILLRTRKEHLIDMIDYALIDEKSNTALGNQLNAVREYI